MSWSPPLPQYAPPPERRGPRPLAIIGAVVPAVVVLVGVLVGVIALFGSDREPSSAEIREAIEEARQDPDAQPRAGSTRTANRLRP